MNAAYRGSAVPAWQVGLCLYSPTPADVACLAEASWHGVTEDRRGASACDEHKPVLERLMRWVHRSEPACGLPEAAFVEEENRCRLPWGDVWAELASETEVTGGGPR